MEQIRNLLETRSGKIIAATIVSFVVVLIGFIVSIVLISNGEGEEEITHEQEVVEELDDTIASEILYSGTWYSNRPDLAVLTLRKDGTYMSTAWIFEGQFYIEGEQVILVETESDTFVLELHTISGETVLYDPIEGYYFYSSQEQLQEAIKIQQGFKELEADVEQQKWLDVLKQGAWTYSIDEIQYSMMFYDNYFTVENIYEGIMNTETFDYYLVEMYIIEDHIVEIAMRRKRQNYDPNYLPASFQIKETSVKYELTSQIGTFIWNNRFEKSITEVELTQNGVTEAQRSELQSISTDEDGNRVIVREREVE